MPSDVFQLACNFKNLRPLEGAIAISRHTALHYRTYRKVFGGVHTEYILELKTELNKCVYRRIKSLTQLLMYML